MPKHLLRWKGVKIKTVRGTEVLSPLPDTLQCVFYRGRLVSEILDMKKQSPISFSDAIKLVTEKWVECYRSGDTERADWHYEHFLEWISDQGFHIDLTGDEFEPELMSDKVS